MKKLLLSAVVAAVAFGGSVATFMPYGAYIGYSNKSNKDSGSLYGIYASYYNFPFKLELDAEYTKIQFKTSSYTVTTKTAPLSPVTTPTTSTLSSSDERTYTIYNTQSDWNQYDVTLLAHYYQGYNWDYKFGMHNLFIDQKDNPDTYDRVYIAGILYYVYLAYNVGFDFYYSSYDGFSVNQYTFHGGVNFGNYYAPGGSHYVDAKFNYISISKDNVANHKNYSNIDLSYTNTQGPWSTKISGSFAPTAYKVGDGGFVVYNLGDEVRGKGGVDVTYSFSKTASLKVGYTRTYSKEGGEKVFSDTYLISFSKSF